MLGDFFFLLLIFLILFGTGALLITLDFLCFKLFDWSPLFAIEKFIFGWGEK